jgi:2-keto-4-pentenoate hydratase
VSASKFCKLAIEGEIAVVMGAPLRGPGVTLADAIFAAAGGMAAVELVDSRIKDWKMSASEAVADNALHAGVIVGPIAKPIPGMNLRQEGVIISKNGRHLASACGAEALGHPLEVVAWLANKLSESGREIKAGEVILTGSLTQFFFAEPGDVVDVTFSNLGQIQFPVVE